MQVAGFLASGSALWFVLVYAFLGVQVSFGLWHQATVGPMSKSGFSHLRALAFGITYAFCILAPGLRKNQACSCPLQCRPSDYRTCSMSCHHLIPKQKMYQRR